MCHSVCKDKFCYMCAMGVPRSLQVGSTRTSHFIQDIRKGTPARDRVLVIHCYQQHTDKTAGRNGVWAEVHRVPHGVTLGVHKVCKNLGENLLSICMCYVNTVRLISKACWKCLLHFELSCATYQTSAVWSPLLQLSWTVFSKFFSHIVRGTQ
jgi:hypothetical protein